MTGVSVLTTVSKMDAGPILSQTTLKLDGNEKATDLLDKLFQIGTNDLLALLPRIFDKSVKLTEQDESKATAAAKISVSTLNLFLIFDTNS